MASGRRHSVSLHRQWLACVRSRVVQARRRAPRVLVTPLCGVQAIHRQAHPTLGSMNLAEVDPHPLTLRVALLTPPGASTRRNRATTRRGMLAVQAPMAMHKPRQESIHPSSRRWALRRRGGRCQHRRRRSRVPRRRVRACTADVQRLAPRTAPAPRLRGGGQPVANLTAVAEPQAAVQARGQTRRKASPRPLGPVAPPRRVESTRQDDGNTRAQVMEGLAVRGDQANATPQLEVAQQLLQH